MRALLLLVVMIGVVGCAGFGAVPQMVITEAVDLTQYEDFLFTPDPYTGPYEPVALLRVTVTGATRPVNQRTELEIGEYRIGTGHRAVTPPIPADAIDQMHARAVHMGADAVVRLTVHESVTILRGTSVPTIIVEGFAIKRER